MASTGWRKPSRRTALTAIGAAALSGGLVRPAAAYPDRPIILVVPFAPGGPTDIIARILSLSLSQALGQQVVVDNRGGAAGNIGMGQVARATPDGHTLLLASTAIAVNPALFKNLPYDPIKDFAPISELVNAPNVLVVHPDSGINTVADLVARAKAEAVQLCEPGCRHQVPSDRRAAQAARRYRHGARPVPRRRSGGAGGASPSSSSSARWRLPPPKP